VVEALCAEHINLTKAGDEEKLGEMDQLLGKCQRETLRAVDGLCVVVSTTAKNLSLRMSLTSTSDARNEQIKN
jgi:hypothetical protein